MTLAHELTTGPNLALLTTLPGVGPVKALKLASRYRTWSNLRTATDSDLIRIIPASAVAALEPLLVLDHDTLTHDLYGSARPISIFDLDYPHLLRHIPDPPILLWCRGTTPDQTRHHLAIVGTRHPTEPGINATRAAASEAAARGIGVISGAAIGVDTHASATAIDHGGRTWVYLGQGVNTVDHDRSRSQLTAAILANGGGLLSAVPPDTPYGPSHLLTSRNRLQTGTAHATLITQTGVATPGKTAGTMHTARYAIEQNRPLAVTRLQPDTGPETAGNRALTAPAGCDPALLYAEGNLAATVRNRHPVADHVITDRTQLIRFLDELLDQPITQPHTSNDIGQVALFT